MGNARHIGRVGAMAVALGVGFAVAATPAVGYAEPTDSVTCQSADAAEPDTTALILGGTTVPTPDAAYVDTVRDHFIAPTHPGRINYCAVTAPMEFWPITGAGRLVWLVLGPPSVWGLDGPGWPDEPLWKLSGLFDLTFGQSLDAGVVDLEDAMDKHPSGHLVIYGYSQGAIIANLEKQRLDEQYPVGTTAPDIDFVLSGDLNVPNGGLSARFPGLYIPIVNVPLNGPEPTDTQFDTVVITRQYDGLADFPLYPLNVISLLNAVLGIVYTHPRDLEVSLADPTTSPPIKRQHGDTDYYFFETEDLPLFAPLRTLGVPEQLIDVVEPFFKVIVELGYDRSIPPWEPTPARLIPPLHPATVAADLLAAIGEGIKNAAALFGSPLPLRSPAPLTLAATATETTTADTSPQVVSTDTPTETEQAMLTRAATRTQQMWTDTAPSTTKVTETANADGFPQVTPTETVTETGDETSGKKSTETATANEAPAGPTAASAPEPLVSTSISEPVKPTVRSATPQPLVRSSLGVGERLSDRPHRGNRGHPSTRPALSSEAAAGPSSVESSPADSSPAGSNSAGGDSSGGDADDSE